MDDVIERWECPVEGHGSMPVDVGERKDPPRCGRYPSGERCLRPMVRVRYVRESEVERLRAALQKVYDAGKPPEGRRWLGNESRIAAIAGEALGLPVTSGKPATPNVHG
jgi:hypothetical protein